MMLLSASNAGGPAFTVPETQTRLQQKNNNTLPRRTGQNNTHIDSLLSPSLGKEINQAHRFSELKSRIKLSRRLPQVSFTPQTV